MICRTAFLDMCQDDGRIRLRAEKVLPSKRKRDGEDYALRNPLASDGALMKTSITRKEERV